MIEEMNESGPVLPETDSNNHAEIPSPEEVVADIGTPEDSCVACNATQQSELVPDTGAGVPEEPDTTDIDEQELDQRISAKAEEIRRHHSESNSHAEAEGACWRDLMPLLEEKQKWLTMRGRKSENNLTAFLRRAGLNPSTVRSWRRRLKKEQAALAEPEAVESEEDSTDTDGDDEGQEEKGKRGGIESGPELLTNFADEMLEVLKGKSIADDATRIRRAVAMLKNLRQAIDEGKLFPPGPVIPLEHPQQPSITGVSRMADTDERGKILEDCPGGVVNPPLEQHPLFPAEAERPFTYSQPHCWQYDIRLKNRPQDLIDSGMTSEEAALIKVRELTFRYVDKSEAAMCKRIVPFIRRHEWLGKMPMFPTHRFVAEHKGQLAGVVVFSMPTAFSKLLGEGTKDLERLISRGACVSWSPKNTASAMLAFAMEWMVNNTQFRLFTCYADEEAQEIGQIYTSLNAIYLGQSSGTKRMYYDPANPKGGYFSDRSFRSRSAWKRYAIVLGIAWEQEWQSGEKIFWDKMPEEISSKLRAFSKAEQKRCHYRVMPRKHKFAMIRGKDRREKRALMKRFAQLNPELVGLDYPKRVNPIPEEAEDFTLPRAGIDLGFAGHDVVVDLFLGIRAAEGGDLPECRVGPMGGVTPRKPPESVKGSGTAVVPVGGAQQ